MDEERLGYRRALDGLRGVAVLMVLAYHLPFGIPNVGHVGVMMFFTLSGFLITTLLLEERERSGRIDLRGFYRRRALRLLPALVAVLSAIVVLDVIVGSQAGYGRPALFSLFYVANWAIIDGVDFHHINHTWSLAIEEHFYLLWPVTLLFVLTRSSKRTLLWIAAAGAIAVWGWRVWLTTSDASLPRIIYATDTRFDGLLIGCVLAIIGWRWLGALASVAAVAAVASLIAVTAIPDERFQLTIGFTAVPIATAVLIGACLAPGWAGNLLAWRPLVPIGVISYGLYLWHLPIFGYVFKYGDMLPRPVQAISAVLLSIGVAALSYRLIEEPFLRLKRPRRALSSVGTAPARVMARSRERIRRLWVQRVFAAKPSRGDTASQRIELPVSATAPRTARRIVRSLDGTVASAVVTDATIVADEFVTKAVLAAPPEKESITLEITRDRHEIIVTVDDVGDRAWAETARDGEVGNVSRAIIDTVADRWGMEKRGTETRAWATLVIPSPRVADREDP
jgi:peptidoglycan/LPS O-acetylase OafA/YrhL